jgi:phosphatidylinositol 4-kinase
MSQRDEHVRDISVNLLTQLRDKFPQVKTYGSTFSRSKDYM